MSHAPQRTEKNCLNCGTTVIGRYCHVCGQENVVPKENFWKLVTHFFYDITHFDSNFFNTLKYLLFRPGFLSKEYLKGRRASYLNPVRMYVFTSAIFFLIFFLVVPPESLMNITDTSKPLDPQGRTEIIRELEKEYKKGKGDSTILLNLIAVLKDTTKVISRDDIAKMSNGNSATGVKKKQSWLDRRFNKKFKLAENSRESTMNALKEFTELFLHKLPYLLFVSLPLFALILKLLYVRKKQFYYADHIIFSIHHYIFSFILLLVCFLLGTIYDYTHLNFFRILLIGFLFIWPVYLFIAMLRFYEQRWFTTTVKFILLNILGLFSLIVLFALFFVTILLLP